MTGPQSFVDVLRSRAAATPDRLAIRFVDSGLSGPALTYAELDRAARSIARELTRLAAPGERALLLYPPGLEYVEAFFGCLYAGVIAVPAYPPTTTRQVPRLAAVLADAGASILLTDSSTVDFVRALLGDQAGSAHWLTTDRLDATPGAAWTPPDAIGETTAFLQYTSGTTGPPKGVVVSHANLLHNSALIHERFGHSPDSTGVIWLPPYHDMGLIGGILQPVYGGFPVALMSPLTFLRDPGVWLGAVSEFAATSSGGPNFAFELCLRKIPESARRTFDLSAWSVAFVGSETVREPTLRAFAEAFAPSGFRLDAFLPCYGLAEATLMVTGGFHGRPPVTISVAEEGLARGRARRSEGPGARALVGCGTSASDQDLAVVDAATGHPRPDGEVGEIWVRGPSVTRRYWGRADRGSEATGELAGACDDGPYLRTGDLGFVQDGELFVTGRAKDVIVIRGRNYAPDAIELSVAGADSRLRPGCAAAFGVEHADGGRLVVLQEVAGPTDLTAAAVTEIVRAIRSAVTEAHGLAVHTVALLRPGTLPKTSSGKIQRSRCRSELAAGTMASVHIDRLGERPRTAAAAHDQAGVAARLAVLQSMAGRVLGVAAEQVPADRPLAELGLDSVRAVELHAALDRDGSMRPTLARLLAGATPAELAADPNPEPDRDRDPHAGGSAGSATALLPIDELTGNERAMWFLDQLSPDGGAYRLCHAVEVTGPITADGLRRAVDRVTSRHPALRTRFVAPAGDPRRLIGESSVRLDTVDATGWDRAQVDALVTELADESFDLAKGPLWRFRHLMLAPDRHVLALATHHIVADLWSLAIVVRELVAALAGAPLPDNDGFGNDGFDMRHVAAAEAAYLDSAEADLDADRWRTRLDNAPAAIDLATDRPRPTVMSYRGAGHRFQLPTDMTGTINGRARQWGVTPYSVLLSSFAWLLYRYTGTRDIVIGAPTPGRGPAAHDVVGMLVNTLPVRCHVDPDQTFHDAVADVAAAARDCLAGQRFPFARLVELAQPRRDPSRSPVFQVVLTLQQAPGHDDLPAFGLGHGRLDIAALTVAPWPVPTASAPFDLTVYAVEHGGELQCELRFNTDLWDRATIERLAGHWQVLLAQVCADPELRAADVSLLCDAERRELLAGLATDSAPVAHRALDAGLAEWAAHTPDQLALVDGRFQLTYEDLNRLVAVRAARLRRAGVGPESRVGLLIGRSAAFVVAALSVLRAGGVYVPLDPRQPAQRLAAMIAGSAPQLVLVNGYTAGTDAITRDHGGTLPPVLDVSASEHDLRIAGDPVSVDDPDRAAYIMHTSGTTGRPKGVCCTHGGARNLLDDFAARAPIQPGAVCAWWTSTGFDVSVYEIFEAIDAGATLIVVPERVRLEPTLFAEWLADERVAAGYVPPFAVEAVADLAVRAAAAGTPLALRRLMVGVEPIPHRTLVRLASTTPGLRILNAYGPTETTIIATVFEVDAADPAQAAAAAPLGRPIRNTPVYVLDDRLGLMPMGVPGELYIGGNGVSRGYHGHPGQTADRFRPDPWRPGGRMYRTGDVVRYGRDGQLRFLGRRDNQVKLHGVRIELGEVEAALRVDPRVASAVALVRDLGDQPALVGYVVVPDDDRPTPAEILTGARRLLPATMMPSAVVCLPAWPLTRNGKLDRAALPAPSLRAAGFEEPVGPLELTIAAVWSELLGGGRVGRTDDFFGLGGHSVLAARGALELGRRLDREVPVASVFTNPTVALLAEALGAGGPVDAPIVVVPRVTSDTAALRTQVLALPEYALAGLLGDGDGDVNANVNVNVNVNANANANGNGNGNGNGEESR